MKKDRTQNMEEYEIGDVADIISSNNANLEPTNLNKQLKRKPEEDNPGEVVVKKKSAKENVGGKNTNISKSVAVKNENAPKNVAAKKSNVPKHVAVKRKKNLGTKAITSDEVVKIKKENIEELDQQLDQESVKKEIKDEESEQEEIEDEESEKEEIRDEDTESRTVFVGNLPHNVKKMRLKNWFSKYGEVESVRIKFPGIYGTKVTKKFAAAKEEFIKGHRSTIHAYVKFVSSDSAIKSLQANGELFNQTNHLRVDMASNKEPQSTGKCVFLGNIPFSAQEEQIRKLFQSCGPIENIRLIRDSYTGVGKGIGYINFNSGDAVQLAIEMDGTELNGRPLRVKKTVTKKKNDGETLKKRSRGSMTSMKKKAGNVSMKSNVKSNDSKNVNFQGVLAFKKNKIKRKLSREALKKKKIQLTLTGKKLVT